MGPYHHLPSSPVAVRCLSCCKSYIPPTGLCRHSNSFAFFFFCYAHGIVQSVVCSIAWWWLCVVACLQCPPPPPRAPLLLLPCPFFAKLYIALYGHTAGNLSSGSLLYAAMYLYYYTAISVVLSHTHREREVIQHRQRTAVVVLVVSTIANLRSRRYGGRNV